jgi:hypothetical protein
MDHETASPTNPPPAVPPAHRKIWARLLVILVVVLLGWFLTAYLVMPALWERYGRRHPSLEDIPGITYTGFDAPGDPLNVALIGTKAEVIKVMLAAGWTPSDPLSLKSCLEIAEATVFKRPYRDAPVSNLYLFGRKEDLAFEYPVGDNPRERNHVRFWETSKRDPDGRPLWIGSATFDKGVGLSHTTGQITHHIAADVDAERDFLFKTLEETGDLSETYVEKGFHKTLEGKNGGGDPWHTDGNLYVGVISLKGAK